MRLKCLHCREREEWTKCRTLTTETGVCIPHVVRFQQNSSYKPAINYFLATLRQQKQDIWWHYKLILELELIAVIAVVSLHIQLMNKNAFMLQSSYVETQFHGEWADYLLFYFLFFILESIFIFFKWFLAFNNYINSLGWCFYPLWLTHTYTHNEQLGV